MNRRRKIRENRASHEREARVRNFVLTSFFLGSIFIAVYMGLYWYTGLPGVTRDQSGEIISVRSWDGKELEGKEREKALAGPYINE